MSDARFSSACRSDSAVRLPRLHRGRPSARALALWVTTAVLLAVPAPAAAQGSDGAAVAGAALGAYSGFVLGGAAALIPCNQTYSGLGCVRAGALIGTGAGLASGIALGLADSDDIEDAYARAGIGLAAGSLALLALKPFLDRWSWPDVAAGAVIGSSIAAAGKGAWIGLAVGSGVGVAVWQLVPGAALPDAVGIGLLGMAFGGIASWVADAVDAEGDGSSPGTPVFSIRLAAP
jgi:hypothetical protein